MSVRVVRGLEADANLCFRCFCAVETTPRWVAQVNKVRVRQRHFDGLAAQVEFQSAADDGGTVEYTLIYAYDREGLRVTWRTANSSGGVTGYAAFVPGERPGSCTMTYVLEYGEHWPGDRETDRQRAQAIADAFAQHVRTTVDRE